MGKWYQETADNDEIVVSARIRLARNLSKYNFQERLGDEEAEKMVSELRELTSELSQSEGVKYYSCNVNRQSELEKESMVEWHIISPALGKKKQDTGLILSDDESISIMLNEEDHIRLQSVVGGFNMRKAWRAADKIDNFLDERLDYAYSEKYGYLTSCPTNVGTGLRASYMLFLPALTLAAKIEKLADEVAKYGVVIRGIYGEGTKSLGFMYQVSNQKTLGCSEQDIMDSLTRIVSQIIVQEKKHREIMLSSGHRDLEDKVYRSYGVLRYARQLDTQDATMLLSQLKLGVDLKLISLKGGERFNFYYTMMELQPANLQKLAGGALGSDERKRFRAELLNSRLPEIS